MFAENKRKKELIQMLQQMGYDSDPVKAWKQAQEKVKSPKLQIEFPGFYLCLSLTVLFK